MLLHTVNPAAAAAAAPPSTVFRWPMLYPAGHRNINASPVSPLRSTFVRRDAFFRKPTYRRSAMVCTALFAGGRPYENGDDDPYEVLGVSLIEGFLKLKLAYQKKRKDALQRKDKAYVTKLDNAYERIIMSHLENRKKGLAFGSLEVSKDIKYADKQPIVPWGPRYSKSSFKDMRINLATSTIFSSWTLIQQNAEWKPLQFLAFVFFYRIFLKLKAFEPAVTPTLDEYGEEKGRGIRIGKRILRSIALVFGCITLSSLGFTGLLNLIEFTGHIVPLFVLDNQELLITMATSLLLYVVASYYR